MLKLSALLLLLAAVLGLIASWVINLAGIGLLPLTLALFIFALFIKELGH